MLAKTTRFSRLYLVDVDEALGLSHAIQWVIDMYFDNIDFKFDSKLALNAFNYDQDDATKFKHVISVCKCSFPSRFTNLSLVQDR